MRIEVLESGEYRAMEDQPFVFPTYWPTDLRPESTYMRAAKGGQVFWSDFGFYVVEGFTWDGPSGPTIDTPNTLMPSACHDACYEGIRKGYLTPGCRRYADRWFRDLLKKKQTNLVRRWVWWASVRMMGWRHVRHDRAVRSERSL